MLRRREIELRRLKNLLSDIFPLSVVSKKHYTGWRDGCGFEKVLPYSWGAQASDGSPAVFVNTFVCNEVPPIHSVHLRASFGGESLLLIDDEPYGEFNEFHREVDLTRFCDGRPHSIRVETVARGLFGSKADGVFRYAFLITYDERVRTSLHFLRNVIEVAEETTEDALAQALIELLEGFFGSVCRPRETAHFLSTLSENTEALHTVSSVWSPPDTPDEFEVRDDELIATLLREFDRFRERLGKVHDNFPKAGHAFVAGHSHIDYAWLWPVEETKRKIVRTFANAAHLAEKYDGFIFVQSSAQMYEDLKECSPWLFEKVRELVTKGNWVPVGGMWVEADCNVPSVESLIRQFHYGQKFLERAFGKRSTVAWLPDVFGFPWTLPQILRLSGIDYFFTTKLNWNEFNRFPYDLCIWRGIDGSEVLYYSFNNPENSYNGSVSARSLLRTYDNFRSKHLTKKYFFTFGHGDGGGGPTEEMCLSVEPLNSIPGVPHVSYASPERFVEELKQEVNFKKLPIWDGELYLELHRATYTSQSRLKRLHRIAEDELRTTELINATMCGEAQGEIDELWKIVLRNQFHDILPGSAIREVYERAEKELREVIERCEMIQRSFFTQRPVADNSRASYKLTLFNPSSFSQALRFELELPISIRRISLVGECPTETRSDEVRKVRVVRTHDGMYAYAANFEVPPLGYAVIDYEPCDASSIDVSASLPEPHPVEACVLENEYLLVKVFEDGAINVLDKRTGRWTFRERGNVLAMYNDVPAFWDNWDTDHRTTEHPLFLKGEDVRIVQNDGSRKVVIVRYSFGRTSIVQEYVLEEGLDYLLVRTRLDWHHRRAVLKALFETDVLARTAKFDIDGGFIERPTHKNTSWDIAKFEVPAHRWVDISEYDHGVCVINDSKYGHAVRGSTIELTLVKAGIYPDFLSDEGPHECNYVIYPHGKVDVLDFYRRAERVTRPLKVFVGEPENAPHLLRLGGERLRVLSLRKVGNVLILRLLEPLGGSGKFRFSFRGLKPTKVFELNALDEEINILDTTDGIVEFDFRPFKIYTFGIPLD